MNPNTFNTIFMISFSMFKNKKIPNGKVNYIITDWYFEISIVVLQNYSIKQIRHQQKCIDLLYN